MVLQVDEGCSAYEAVLQSDIVVCFPQIDLDNDRMGIFGQIVEARKYRLKEGDRVEIYRPLLVDPKESRRVRAAKVREGKLQKKPAVVTK